MGSLWYRHVAHQYLKDDDCGLYGQTGPVQGSALPSLSHHLRNGSILDRE